MKNKKLFRPLAIISALALIVAIVCAVRFPAQMQKIEENAAEAQNGGAGKSSGLVRLPPGQTVRVSAVNVSNKNIPLELIIVDSQGKVLIQRDAISLPGKAVSDTFSIPDGTSNVLFYAQVRVWQNVGNLKELIPSLEVYDTQVEPDSKPHYVLSGGDFVEIRPIWVP